MLRPICGNTNHRKPIAIVHNDVQKGDTHMQWYESMVFHLSPDGKIVEFWGIHEDAEAVDNLWKS